MKRKLLLATAAILGGSAIYLLLRPRELLFFQWIGLRDPGWLSRFTLPDWIIYSLPDGLWAFACALLISALWSDSRTRLRIFWLAVIPVFVLGFECSQLLPQIPGTFDPVDIAFCCAGLVLGICIGDLKPKLTHHEECNA